MPWLSTSWKVVLLWLVVSRFIGCGHREPAASAGVLDGGAAKINQASGQPRRNPVPGTSFVQTKPTFRPTQSSDDLLRKDDTKTGPATSPESRAALAASAQAAGIRQIRGKHLTLYTDIPPDDEIDALAKVFDLAVPQWGDYFGVDPARHADWHMDGCLMRVKERFQAAGLLPADLPAFAHGYFRGRRLWVYEQPTAYYRRHLLLHEGVHGFMDAVLGGCGPPWYMEGTAELLATHTYHDGRLTVRHFPAHVDEVPMLGRIELVRRAVAQGRQLDLGAIRGYSNRAHLENEPYGWCWAAAAFLDGHPRYREAFRKLNRYVTDPEFERRVDELLADVEPQLAQEWQLFAGTLEHGHDIARTAIDFQPGKPLETGTRRVAIAVDRGWQNTGVHLAVGTSYQIKASGRYQVADQPKIWWCEPGGVTIRYHRGRPLGMLLAAVRPDEPAPAGDCPWLLPIEVGTGTTLTPKESGTLYFQINDSPAELDDNAGQITVDIAAP